MRFKELICLILILFIVITGAGCASLSSNHDMTTTPTTFPTPIITPYRYTTFITIDPINPHKAGESFTISGITNIGSDRQILVEIAEDYIQATRIRKDGKFYGIIGNATISQGINGINRWEFHVNTSGWLPQQYYVYVFPASRDENFSRVYSTLNLTS